MRPLGSTARASLIRQCITLIRYHVRTWSSVLHLLVTATLRRFGFVTILSPSLSSYACSSNRTGSWWRLLRAWLPLIFSLSLSKEAPYLNPESYSDTTGRPGMLPPSLFFFWEAALYNTKRIEMWVLPPRLCQRLRQALKKRKTIAEARANLVHASLWLWRSRRGRRVSGVFLHCSVSLSQLWYALRERKEV